MDNNPLISVVTCTYNCMEDVANTIESVLSQSFKNYEHVVIDGESTDGTKEYLHGLYKEGRFTVFLSERDEGVYDALNKGIRACRGDVIGILHAGTTLQPGALESLARVIEEEGRDRLIAGSVEWRRGNQVFYELRSQLDSISSRNTKILHESIYVPKSRYDQVGGYDTQYKISADYDWISRAEISGALSVVYTDKVIIRYEDGWGVSGSIENERLKIKEHYSISKEYVGFAFSFRRYAFRLAKLAVKRVLGYGTNRS